MPIDKHLQVALSDSYIDLSVHSPDARLRKPPSDFHRHHVLGFYRFRIAGQKERQVGVTIWGERNRHFAIEQRLNHSLYRLCLCDS
jgi:hypothetical protein